jgi:hypothetical protein
VKSAPEKGPQEFRGALNIRIHRSGEGLHSTAEILLADPQERRTGSDPRIKNTFSEIPNSSYESESIDDAVSGAPGPVTKIIDIRNPMDGVYTLKIIGIESGRYSLEIMGYDKNMDFSDAKYIDIEIKKDGEHVFTIKYASDKSSDFRVTPPLDLKKKRRTESHFGPIETL